MSNTKTRKTAPRKPKEQTYDEALVKAAVLAGFLNNQLNAIDGACKKVSEDRADAESAEHCKYFLDGARELANTMMDMIAPIKAGDLIKGSAAFVNNLAANADKIAADCKINRAFVDSYINGARKMSDILITALVNSPREQIAKEDNRHD